MPKFVLRLMYLSVCKGTGKTTQPTLNTKRNYPTARGHQQLNDLLLLKISAAMPSLQSRFKSPAKKPPKLNNIKRICK
ncbi:hypothetical protein M5D96_008459 [Drosophila gunungcola]|uniref:Uncharacterized protein n=1 Tax=Drosophila gunungcola TaxID=103775 RepID=A0A9Q0BN31_9MUSC|nr:hypothetical protein M5D96_008459 [Drosophila gunungcola]